MSLEEKLKIIEHLTTDRAWDSFISKDKDFDVVVLYKLAPKGKRCGKEFFSVDIFDDFMQWAVVNLYDVEVLDATKKYTTF